MNFLKKIVKSFFYILKMDFFLLISLFLDKNVYHFPNQNWVLIQCVKLFFCWWLSHYQGRDYARFWLKLAQVISKPTPNLMGYQQEYNVICDNRFKAGSNFFWWQIPPKKTLCGWVPSEIFLVENWELEALRTKVRVVA